MEFVHSLFSWIQLVGSVTAIFLAALLMWLRGHFATRKDVDTLSVRTDKNEREILVIQHEISVLPDNEAYTTQTAGISALSTAVAVLSTQVGGQRELLLRMEETTNRLFDYQLKKELHS